MCSFGSFSCAGKLVYHLTATVQIKPCKPSHPGSILLLFWHQLWTHRKTGQHKQVITINSQNERTTTALFFSLYPLLLSTGQLNNLLAGPGRRDRWLSWMRLLLMPGLKSMLVAGIEMKPLQHVLTVSFERGSWLHVFTHIILLLHSHPLRRIWWDAALVLCDYPVWLWLTVPGLICTEHYFAFVYNLIMLNTVGITS